MAKTKGTFVVPRNFDHEGKRFATKVNESIAQLKGELGDPLDGAVTFRDLINSGIAKRDIRIGSNGQIVGGNSNNITFGDEDVLLTPPAPTGVSADGAFQNIVIEWDVPTFFSFSHAEVWAANTDTFADRVFIGQTTAAVFSHQVGNGQTRYYWIRFVNTQDTVGPFNSTTGTQASTSPDIGALMADLSETLQDLPGYSAITTLITNGDVANAAAAATANTAARVIRSTSAPTTRDDGSALVQNDIWIDTNDNNQMYIRNASNNGWEEARDGTLVTLVNNINTQQGTNTTNIATATSDIITLTTANSSRVSEITALESTINDSSTGLAAAHSAISTEATTRATADTALASDITSLTSTVSSNTAAISSEATTRASADTALATDITNLTSTVGTNTSDIATEQTTRANADTALATDITNLTSTVSGNTAAISTEATTRANADTALATDITNLTATVSGNTAAISTEATTRAAADTANATAITNLSTTVGTTNSNVSTLQTAVSNLEGDADAMFVLQVATESNGSKSAAGMVIGSNASSGSGAQSYVQFQADKFAIWSGSSNIAPFIVSGGTVFMKDAMIQNGAITNAKIGTAAIDDAKIANLSATKITSGLIDTARINVAGLITAGGLIVGSDLSTNGATTIHGGNITTNTITANKLTITPLEAGQAAADINSNTTTIDGGKITTNTVSATQINTTNLFLPSFGGEKTGTTLGYWNENDLNYRHVAEIGSGSGFYTGYIRVYKGSFAGQIKTISFLISDGTFGTSSSYNVNTSVTFSDTTKVLESASHAILVTPDLEYLSGGWIAASRLTTGKDSSNIPLSFRYTGSGTLNIFIYAQGDSNTQYMGGADARFVHFST